MKDIRISPAAQVVGLLAVLGGVGAAVAAQAPEIKRYLQMRAM